MAELSHVPNTESKEVNPAPKAPTPFGTKYYHTPMEKTFGFIQHVVVDFGINGVLSVGLTWLAKYGSLNPFYEHLERGFAEKLRLGPKVGHYLAEIFTLHIVGHLLAPTIILMENHRAGAIHKLDDAYDKLRGRTPDAEETALRQAAYARMEAKPKVTWWETVNTRVIGLLINLVVQGQTTKKFNLAPRFERFGRHTAQKMNINVNTRGGQIASEMMSIVPAEAYSCGVVAATTYATMKYILGPMRKFLERRGIVKKEEPKLVQAVTAAAPHKSSADNTDTATQENRDERDVTTSHAAKFSRPAQQSYLDRAVYAQEPAALQI